VARQREAVKVQADLAFLRTRATTVLADVGWWVGLVAVLVLLSPATALAVPSFAEQTGQPCAACHVGAFGPQLKQYGRDFKLNGYVAGDGKNHGLPLAVTSQQSFTHTDAAQPTPPAPHFADNNNFAIDR
jgi:hypothetical protein